MTNDRQMFLRSVAEAMAALLQTKYPTAKQLARAAKIDPSTAENLRKGHLSITTLEKIALTEGRGFWERLGDEIYGETFLDHEERRLQHEIREATNAHQNVVRLRERREALVALSAHLDAVDDRQAAVVRRRSQRGHWPAADEPGHRPARGQTPSQKGRS